MERTFPVHSPKIERLEVVAKGDVRRAKLYYLRGRVGRRARVAERRWGIEDELVMAPEEAQAVDSEGLAQSEAETIEPPEEAEAAEEGTEQAEGEGEGAVEETAAEPQPEEQAEAGGEEQVEGEEQTESEASGDAGADQAVAEPEPSEESDAEAEDSDDSKSS